MASIIVHGGACTFGPHEIEAARAGCRRAAELGRDLLQQGMASVDVVELVVMALEDDPVFNAGTGSQPNTAGAIEMDAILVDGATLEFGSVAGIQNVLHPVSVARAVMEKTPHCMLTGQGAAEFAEAEGFEGVSTEVLLGKHASVHEHGTVGAVAMDARGHVAAATSTGGMPGKLPGRVGDSPLIGCGALAEDGVGGVSATGHGESLMRVMMASTVAGYLRLDMRAREAADLAVRDLAERTGGEGGVICIDAAGGTGYAFNTTHLALAHCVDDAPTVVAL